MKYEPAPDIESTIKTIAQKLDINHDFTRIRCVRSRGSKSRYTIARCHALPKIMQYALETKAHYVIELISEKFDTLSSQEQTKTLIHELLHIPKSFGGGFRQHDYVCNKTVDRMYQTLQKMS
ncbi:MAG: metallopeptidase [Candidatus Aenigmarchaeota archaeon]|nr:metallopeptidase [Candidatus Aenigmarchaeota archaeon]